MCVNIELLLKMYFHLATALILGAYHNDVVSDVDSALFKVDTQRFSPFHTYQLNLRWLKTLSGICKNMFQPSVQSQKNF